MLVMLFKRKCFSHLFEHFLETELTWSQPIIVKECKSKNQNLCFASR